MMTARRLTGPGRGGCACGATAPSWSSDGGEIAFAGTDESGNSAIYIVNVTTGELRRVTHSHWFETSPAWSPDGRQIAFVRGTHDSQSLWIVNVENGDLTHVSTLPAENPAWSPDGRTIAFSRSGAVALDGGIWLVRSDGSGLRRLANAAVTSDGNLSWSPDGSEIAFAAPRSDGQAPYVDVKAVNVTTGEVRVVARGFDYPTWAPDRRAILALKP
jgi:TolB protein